MKASKQEMKMSNQDMKTSKQEMQRTMKYAKEHIKRVPFDMQKEDYLHVKGLADEAGSPLNGYIKEAIRMREMIDSAPDGLKDRVMAYLKEMEALEKNSGNEVR